MTRKERERKIILTARVTSMVFTPFYLPILGLIALFYLSYLSLLPWSYKLFVLAMVYLFTILLPTFPLKFFFNDSYVTENGDELSTRQIKIALQEIVDNEDKKHPMSDDALKEILNKKGYPIARRTIAKYRDHIVTGKQIGRAHV